MKTRILATMTVLALLTPCVYSAECARTIAHPEYGDFGPLAVSGDQAAVVAGAKVLIFDLSVPQDPALKGEVTLERPLRCLALAGDLLLVGTEDAVLVFDLSVVETPVQVARVVLPKDAIAIDVEGETAWLVTSYSSAFHSGVLVGIDLRDPGTPRVLARVPSADFLGDLEIEDGVVYVAAGNDGILIYDVSDPDAVVELGVLSDVVAWDLELGDDVLWVGRNFELHAFDTSDPANPVQLSLTDLSFDSAATGAMAAVNGHLYLGLGRYWESTTGGGVAVMDVHDPSAPEVAAVMDFNGVSGDMALLGSNLVISDSERGLRVVDISVPTSPTELHHRNMSFDEVFAVAAVGELAFVGDRGLRVLDVSNSLEPRMIASLEAEDYTTGVDAVDDAVAMVDWQGRVSFVDVSDPTRPELAGVINTEVESHDVALHGGLALVAADDGLRVIRRQQDGEVHVLGFAATAGPALTVAASGDLAFVGVEVRPGGDLLTVVDLSVPADPWVVSTVAVPHPAAGVAVYGTNVVTVARNMFTVVDVSDPALPVILGQTPDAWGVRVAISGQVAYVADSPGSLFVVDLAIPAAPAALGHLVWQPFTIADGPNGGCDVAVGELGRVLVADGPWGLRVIDTNGCVAEELVPDDQPVVAD